MAPKRLALPNPKHQRSMAEQMGLEQVSATEFRSLAGAPYGGHYYSSNGGEPRPRAFGGHVYAQAVYAASKTVPRQFFIHSTTGYFTIIGKADESFIYRVRTIRDGGNYAVRQVDVVQGGDAEGYPEQIVFTSMCSFKRTQEPSFTVQVKRNLAKEYKSWLGGKTVEELPVSVDMNAVRHAKQVYAVTRMFPGMLTTLLPLETLQKDIKPMERTTMFVYTGAEEEEEAILDACVHLMHSDRESMWACTRQYDLFDKLDVMSSLSHTVVFHTGPSSIRLRKDGQRRWFYHETFCKRMGDGRLMHQGAVYDADGNHVISTMQDGAIRLKWASDEERLERQNKVASDSKL